MGPTEECLTCQALYTGYGCKVRDLALTGQSTAPVAITSEGKVPVVSVWCSDGDPVDRIHSVTCAMGRKTDAAVVTILGGIIMRCNKKEKVRDNSRA